MCWTEIRDKVCKACQAILDACKHKTTFVNLRGYRQCVFCNKEHEKVKEVKKEKDVCPYCKTEYRIVKECSQMCMAK